MKTSERGFVLVCVLWVLAILIVLVVGFQRRAMMEARAARFTLDHMQAMEMARGAVARGIVEARNKGTIDGLYKQGGRTSMKQRWAHTVDMLQENAYFTEPAEEFKDEKCKYILRDEESLICINAADENLLKNIDGLSLTAVRKIMARRMGDRDRAEPPQPFQTLEEVREIEGIRDKDWFGDEKNVGLQDILTCWGDGKININTASADVLKCIPDVHANAIDAIIGYRVGSDGELGTDDDQDFATMNQIAEATGIGGESLIPIQQHCKVDSQFFTIKGMATRRQGKVVATCVATIVMNEGSTYVMKWREEFLDS